MNDKDEGLEPATSAVAKQLTAHKRVRGGRSSPCMAIASWEDVYAAGKSHSEEYEIDGRFTCQV
jgi:hypothetical protein